MNPDNHPFGETMFKNYDPDQINSVEDAVNLFRWLSEENRDAGNMEAESVFRECADLLETEVVSE